MPEKYSQNITIMNVGDNIFNSRMATLVNTVNCVGIMGKGLAKEFKKHFPEMYDDYKKRCEREEVKPGIPYFWKNSTNGKSVLNFPTKRHWRGDSRFEWIESGLKKFVQNYRGWGIDSIAFPALGCSNGGLEWQSIEPLMLKNLQPLRDITIEIYPPSSSPAPVTNKVLKDKRLKNGPRHEVSLFTTASHLRDEDS